MPLMHHAHANRGYLTNAVVARRVTGRMIMFEPYADRGRKAPGGIAAVGSERWYS